MIEAHLKARRPLPKAIQEAPEILPGLELYYEAYLDLQSHRNGCIPWIVVDDYGRRWGFSEDQMEALHYHIRHLDAVYLEVTEAGHGKSEIVRGADERPRQPAARGRN